MRIRGALCFEPKPKFSLYNYILSFDKNVSYLVASVTCSYYELDGLMLGVKYYFRVAAITPDEAIDFSALALKIVLMGRVIACCCKSSAKSFSRASI